MREIVKKEHGSAGRIEGSGLRDRIRAQELLVNELRTLLDVDRDAIIIRDMEGKIVLWNSGAVDIFGIPKDEAIGRQYAQVLSLEYPVAYEQIKQELEISGRWEGEISFKPADKPAVILESRLCVQKDETGSPIALLEIDNNITACKMAEVSLRESEERYRTFLQHYHGIAFRVNLDDTVSFFEGKVEEITGYTSADFISGVVRWQQLIFPDDWESIQLSWSKIRTVAGFSIDRQYRIICKDQKIKWLHEHIHNQCDAAGRPVFFEGTMHDITDLKKANEDLLWLASFPELNPNPIIEVDVDGRIFYMSPAAIKLFPGIPESGIKHPYLAGLRWVVDRIVSEKRQFFSRDVEVDGLWYSQKIFTVENNARLRIYGVDITESKLISQRLHLVNQQLMDIIDFLPDATFVIDRHRRVIAWNRAIEELSGVRKEDMIGKGEYEYAIPFYGKRRPILIDLIGKSDKEIESKYSYIKRKNNSLVAEVFIPRLNNGKGMFVWIKVAPFYDDKGALVGAIESVRDISEHKESEAILRQDREVFEDLVNTKTEQLLRVQKELVDAKHLSEIGALAATIAHELRNPLAAIRTAVYNVRRKTQDAKLYSHLVNIDKKVLESDQIINNLLSYSRIKTPQLERVLIHGVLQDCINAAADRFPKYKVSVRLKCTCKNEDVVRADPLHMRELFNNILNNSYESFRDKKGIITIKADYRRRGNYTVIFTDTGTGISPDDLAKISHPFFTTKSKGTGLGLTVCQQLVALHNGSIDIKSQMGKGTTVTVVLPVGGD
jgi:PAS domain S-box-containing protein